MELSNDRSFIFSDIEINTGVLITGAEGFSDIPVICYGLRTDFTSTLFDGARRLMELADRIVVLCGGQVSGIVDTKKTTKEEVCLLMTKFRKEG